MPAIRYSLGLPLAQHSSRLTQVLLLSSGLFLPFSLFLILANDIRGDQPLPGDVPLLQAVHTLSSPTLDTVMKLITTLSNAELIAPLMLLVTIGLWIMKKRRQSLFLFMVTGGTTAIIVLFKILFKRDRPELWKHLVTESTYSFPSGHAMMTAALALAVVIIFWQTRFRIRILIAAILYVLLVALSRLYLGVHYPSDIYAGWCASAVLVSALWLIFKRLNYNPQISK